MLTFFLVDQKDDPETGLVHATLSVAIGNRSNEPALYSQIKIYMDNDFSLPHLSDFTPAGEVQVKYGEHLNTLKAFVRNLSPTSSMPIYREANFKLCDIPITLKPNFYYHFGYDVSCPGMRKQQFGIILNQGKEIRMQDEVIIGKQ
jgi:hypothetical protein